MAPELEAKSTIYCIDTEFAEDGKQIHLISIGICCEDGREFYAEVQGFDWELSDDWVKQNVKPHLWSQQTDKKDFNAWSNITGNKGGLISRPEIAVLIKQFCDPEKYRKPVFYGYYAAYDWVCLAQTVGPTMMDLPTGWPMYIRDIRYTLDLEGLEHVTQPDSIHNALLDAKWVMNTINKYKVD